MKFLTHPLKQARRDAADFRAENRDSRLDDPRRTAKFWRPETPRKKA